MEDRPYQGSLQLYSVDLIWTIKVSKSQFVSVLTNRASLPANGMNEWLHVQYDTTNLCNPHPACSVNVFQQYKKVLKKSTMSMMTSLRQPVFVGPDQCDDLLNLSGLLLFFCYFKCTFGGLNIPQNSPYSEYTSHLAKNVIIQLDWVWVRPGDSILPPAGIPYSNMNINLPNSVSISIMTNTHKKVHGPIP